MSVKVCIIDLSKRENDVIDIDYFVEIRTWDGEVIERKGPMTEWRADRVDGGLNINLNHDDYYTAIVHENKTGEQSCQTG